MWLLLALLPQQLPLQMLSLLAWSRRQRRSHQGAALGWGCGRSLAMVRRAVGLLAQPCCRAAKQSIWNDSAALPSCLAVAEACITDIFGRGSCGQYLCPFHPQS